MAATPSCIRGKARNGEYYGTVTRAVRRCSAPIRNKASRLSAERMSGTRLSVRKKAKPMVILVVEDECLLNIITSDDLRSAGYDVESAYNADEALDILEHRADIGTLFTDVDMPGSMDGLGLAAAVHDRWPPVHIIITSGKTEPQCGHMPEDSRFIPKPWHVRDVVNVVRSFGN